MTTNKIDNNNDKYDYPLDISFPITLQHLIQTMTTSLSNHWDKLFRPLRVEAIN